MSSPYSFTNGKIRGPPYLAIDQMFTERYRLTDNPSESRPQTTTLVAGSRTTLEVLPAGDGHGITLRVSAYPTSPGIEPTPTFPGPGNLNSATPAETTHTILGGPEANEARSTSRARVDGNAASQTKPTMERKSNKTCTRCVAEGLECDGVWPCEHCTENDTACDFAIEQGWVLRKSCDRCYKIKV